MIIKRITFGICENFNKNYLKTFLNFDTKKIHDNKQSYFL